MFKLTVKSELYGEDVFEYDTREEAEAGQKRIEERAARLDDDAERTFAIEKTEHSPVTPTLSAQDAINQIHDLIVNNYEADHDAEYTREDIKHVLDGIVEIVGKSQ